MTPKTILVVLPIEHESWAMYASNPLLQIAVEHYSNGIKGLAEWAFHCPVGVDTFIAEVGECIFTALDAYDINPKIEQYNRKTIEELLMSDIFLCFLDMFYQRQRDVFETALKGIPYSGSRLIPCRSSDAIALLLNL